MVICSFPLARGRASREVEHRVACELVWLEPHAVHPEAERGRRLLGDVLPAVEADVEGERLEALDDECPPAG